MSLSSSANTHLMALQVPNLTKAVTLLLKKESSLKREACTYCDGIDHNSSTYAYSVSGGVGYEKVNYMGHYG